jgi:hypothetical protein
MTDRAQQPTPEFRSATIYGPCASFLESLTPLDRAFTYTIVGNGTSYALSQDTVNNLQKAVPGRFTDLETGGESQSVRSGFFAIRDARGDDDGVEDVDKFVIYVGPVDEAAVYSQFHRYNLTEGEYATFIGNPKDYIEKETNRVPSGVTMGEETRNDDGTHNVRLVADYETPWTSVVCSVPSKQDFALKVKESVKAICTAMLVRAPVETSVALKRFLHDSRADSETVTGSLLEVLQSRLSELSKYETKKVQFLSSRPELSHDQYESIAFNCTSVSRSAWSRVWFGRTRHDSAWYVCGNFRAKYSSCAGIW